MWFWRILGGLAFLIGGVGLVVPVWPTTVFWIVAALAFARSDPAWRDWIYARPGLGPAIQTFIEHGALNRTSKAAALAGMALAAGISWFVLRQHPWILRGCWVLIGMGAAYVLTRRSA